MIEWYKTVCVVDKNGYFITTTKAELDTVAKDGSYIMPANAIDVIPPESRVGFVALWNAPNWEYVPDHRGKTAYDVKTGTAIKIEDVGELPTTQTFVAPPDNTKPYVWDGQNWNLDIAEQERRETARFQAAKLRKLEEVNRMAQNLVATLSAIDKTPDFEVQSWTLQAMEASAWHLDSTVATPILDTIAAARGIPPDALKQAANAKAQQYQLLVAHIIGQRQWFEDWINAAKADNDLHFEATFTLPQAGAQT